MKKTATMAKKKTATASKKAPAKKTAPAKAVKAPSKGKAAPAKAKGKEKEKPKGIVIHHTAGAAPDLGSPPVFRGTPPFTHEAHWVVKLAYHRQMPEPITIESLQQKPMEFDERVAKGTYRRLDERNLVRDYVGASSPTDPEPAKKNQTVRGGLTEEPMPGEQIFHDSTDQFDPSPFNPRKHFNPDKLLKLAMSIALHGVQSPIRCRIVKGRKEIIFGERRWRATEIVREGRPGFIEAQPDITVPNMVSVMDDKTAAEIQFLENDQREDFTPMEKARGFDYLKNIGYKQNEVADRCSVTPAEVSNFLKLLTLPESWQKRIDMGEVPLYVAHAALRVKDGTKLDEALKVAMDAGSATAATRAITNRFIRPAEESSEWAGKKDDVRKKYGSEIQIMTYEESRGVFPQDVTVLQGMNNLKEYAFAEAKPEAALMVAGIEPEENWGEFAKRYGAPVYAACDGVMNPRLLVRRAQVHEASKTAHQGDAAGNPFKTGQAANKAKSKSEKAAGESKEEAKASHAALVRLGMVEEVRYAIEALTPKQIGAAHEEMAAEAHAFLITSGMIGLAGEFFPVYQLLIAKGAVAEDGERPLSKWEGAEESRLASDSLAICSWLFHFLSRDETDTPRENEAWKKVAMLYSLSTGKAK